MKRILAISSSGGHWEQLMLLKDAFHGHSVVYVTTKAGLAELYGVSESYVVADCSRNELRLLVRSAVNVFNVVRHVRPEIIVSTGAAPGILAIVVGRIFGAKTIWIDSVANSEELSMSGKIAGFVAHVQFTQWEHLARDGGPRYAGSVL